MSGWQTFCNYWDLFPAYSKYPDFIYGFSCIYFHHSAFCILLTFSLSIPSPFPCVDLPCLYATLPLLALLFYFLSLRLHPGLLLCGHFFSFSLGRCWLSFGFFGWLLMTTVFYFHTLSFSLHSMTKTNEKRLYGWDRLGGLYGMGVLWLFYLPFIFFNWVRWRFVLLFGHLLLLSRRRLVLSFLTFLLGGSGVYFIHVASFLLLTMEF